MITALVVLLCIGAAIAVAEVIYPYRRNDHSEFDTWARREWRERRKW